MSELLPASEWENILGVSVLDPDGWKERYIPWTQEITKEQFLRFAGESATNWSEYDRKRNE